MGSGSCRKGNTFLATKFSAQASRNEPEAQATGNSRLEIEVALLSGCQDRHYAFGLAMALASNGASVEVIGSDEIDSHEFHTTRNLRFLNFRSGSNANAGVRAEVVALVPLLPKTHSL